MIGRFAILLPYFRQQRTRLFAIVATTIPLAAISVIYPWPIKLLVDYALNDTVNLWGFSDGTLIVLAAAGLLALYAIGALFDVVLSWLWMAGGQHMVYSLMVDIFDHLLHVPVGREKRKVGDSLERLFSDTWCVYTVASDAFISPLQQMVTLAGILIVAIQVDFKLTLLSLVATPAIALSVHWFGPRLKQLAKRGRESRAELTSFVHQTLTSLPLVQAYWTQSHHQDRYHDLSNEVVATAQQRVLVNKAFSLVNGILSETGRALVLLVGGAAVLRGDTTIGTLLLFMSYVRTMQRAFEKLLKTYARLRIIEASVDRLEEFLSLPTLQRSGSRATALPSHRSGAAIRFEHVFYEYVPGVAALNNVSFEIAAGEQVGIVGASGAGKSTLAILLASLDDPSRGNIYFNSVDLQQVAVEAARRQVSLLLQEPHLLPMSVADNIALGKRNATRNEVEQAAALAGADAFIRELPQGYNTVLSERGTSLSLGQQQRLAIARVFLRDAPIVVLDEPTSALDAASEQALVSSLTWLTDGKTSIVVSHRLTTLQNVDRMLVFDHGVLVEQGPPSTLLAKQGYFYRFHAAQNSSAPAEACP